MIFLFVFVFLLLVFWLVVKGRKIMIVVGNREIGFVRGGRGGGELFISMVFGRTVDGCLRLYGGEYVERISGGGNVSFICWSLLLEHTDGEGGCQATLGRNQTED